MTAVVVGMCILIPQLTSHGLHKVRAQLSAYEGFQEEIILAQDLQLQIANVWQFMTDASLTREKDAIEKEAKGAYDKAQKIIARLLELNKDDPAETATLKKLQQALPVMWQKGAGMFEAYGRSFAEGNKAMEEYDKACDLAIKDGEEISAKSKADGRLQMGQVSGTLAQLTTRVYGGGGFATVIGIAVIILMLVLRRSIVLALKKVIDEVSRLTQGDLSSDKDLAPLAVPSPPPLSRRARGS